jgi:DNA-binding MarR family transcriptional regulator
MNDALLLDDDDYVPATLRLEIFRCFRAQAREFTAWLQRHIPELEGLHASDREALRLIAMRETILMADLALDLKLGISATSIIVARLEKLGLCIREKNPYDRRSRIIHFLEATPHGQSVVRELTTFAGELQWKFASLNASELETLLTLLKKL